MGSVLLIGGGSSAGKTTAATMIASWPSVTTRLRRPAPAGRHPDAFHCRSRLGLAAIAPAEPPSQDTELLRGPIMRAVERMRESGGVIEGEGIEPDLVTRLQRRSSVSVVYVIETDSDRIRATLNARRPNGRFVRDGNST